MGLPTKYIVEQVEYAIDYYGATTLLPVALDLDYGGKDPAAALARVLYRAGRTDLIARLTPGYISKEERELNSVRKTRSKNPMASARAERSSATPTTPGSVSMRVRPVRGRKIA